MRLGDGRWRATGPDKHTWREPDEDLAIAQYHEWEARKRGNTISIPTASADGNDNEALKQAILAASPSAEGERWQDVRGTFQPGATSLPKEKRRARAGSIVIELNDGRFDFFASNPTQGAAFWGWLRKLILERYVYVAQMTGIAGLANLPDLKPPAASPKMKELMDAYAAKPGLSQEEICRCRRYWDEFVKLTGIKTLRELTHEIVDKYEKDVRELGLAPKSMKHRFSGVRTIIAHAMRRGKGIEDCRRALDVLAMLQVDNAMPLDPHPISVADFWAIYKKAEEAKDDTFTCMMLFSLNAALYPGEAGAVKWAEIDLKRAEFVTRRHKTGVPRVACLWDETIESLKKVPKFTNRETVFHTAIRTYTRFSIGDVWNRYRDAAKVSKKVVYSDIRDASFTTACRTSLDGARVLAGHRLPGAVDNYVLRQPQFVADVCTAIHDAFFPPKKTAKR